MHSVISALITVFGIMLLGLITERRRALAPTMALCLNQFVYWISLPALIFNQMCAISSAENAVAYIWGTLAASILCYILAVLFFSRFGKKLDLEGTIRALSAVFPNAAFFGLPFIIMTFPGSETAVTGAMLGALLYTVVLLIADASLDILHTEKASRKGIARLLLGELVHNPMIIGAALGLMVSFSGANPPASILHIADMLGSTAAPCALFGMGMVLSAQISGS
ncbi:MAG: AEC family transporter, partial [Mailhella sp.]